MPRQVRQLSRRLLSRLMRFLERRARNATRAYFGLLLGVLADHLASPEELAAENRLLRSPRTEAHP